jgi:hypothetical protein
MWWDRKGFATALDRAVARVESSPRDTVSLIVLGDLAERAGWRATAARLYGSIAEFGGEDPAMWRLAGARLERLGEPARGLVIATYARAVALDPSSVEGLRSLAWALVRADAWPLALATMTEAHARAVEDPEAGRAPLLRQELAVLRAAMTTRGHDPGPPPWSDPGLQWPTDAPATWVVVANTDNLESIALHLGPVDAVDFPVLEAPDERARLGWRPLDGPLGPLAAQLEPGVGGRLVATVDRVAHARTTEGLLQVLHDDGAGTITIDARPFHGDGGHGDVALGEIDP